MHPFIDFVAKNYQRFLGDSTLDFCKIFHMMLHKNKTNFVIVLVGNKNLVADSQGFISLAKLFDTLVNMRGYDGKLIVIDTDSETSQKLLNTTSDKVTVANDDWVTVLSSLAATLEKPVDLLFFDDGANNLVANTYSKNTKPITVIDDVLDDDSILALGSTQKDGKLASEIDTWADDQGKKVIVNNRIVGWVW